MISTRRTRRDWDYKKNHGSPLAVRIAACRSHASARGLLMEMKRLIRRMLRRQQRIAYFFICFLFLALAIPLARTHGRVATFALCAGFIMLLEIGYRRLMIFEARNSRRWWAKQRNRPRIRLYFYLFFVLLSLLLKSSFARYALLSLLLAGLICAGAIRLLTKDDSDFSLHLNDERG